jgi:hypothetical protein
MAKKKIINVQGADITLIETNDSDYISLTDMAKGAGGNEQFIYNWMRTRYALDFMGLWENLNNPVFKPLEFERFKNESGANTFLMTPKKWIEATAAIGIFSKAGRYGGGTFAHQDIAFEFGTWLSPAFKLYLIKEFQRLKTEENDSKGLEWDLRRNLSKINYHIHTEAVKTHLIPPRLQATKAEAFIYANEADLLNLALFGTTAKEWKLANPHLKGNMRDLASPEQLVILVNLENLNAEFIKQGLNAADRLKRLNDIAIQQMSILVNVSNQLLLPDSKPE